MRRSGKKTNKMKYRCPQCNNEDMIEYKEFIECPICKLDFDLDNFLDEDNYY